MAKEVSEGAVARQLRDWIAQGAPAALANEIYAALVSRDSQLFEELRNQRILSVAPAPVSRDVVGLARTPLGVLSMPLVYALGIADALLEHVIANLNPFCGRCNRLADQPKEISQIELPQDGVIAVSVIEQDATVPLSERCEWLGCERVLIAGRLVRVEDLTVDDGEPVIASVAASDRERLKSEVGRWFGRGGGSLRLVHFIERDGVGAQLGTVSGKWLCTGCDATFSEPALSQLDEAPLCAACHGHGWIRDETKRFVACRACNGFGVNTEMVRYEFCGVLLGNVAALSFADLSQRLRVDDLSLKTRLWTVIDLGFGDYPLGTPICLLSQGERALLTALCGELSGFRDLHYVLDGAVVGGELRDVVSLSSDSKVVVARPAIDAPNLALAERPSRSQSDSDIVLRDIRLGCLRLSEVRFPLGGISAITGVCGSGKSLLLSIVEARFAKRRKLAYQCSFGDCKRLSLVRAEVDCAKTVLEALGLVDELASEIAHTRKAQELGVLKEDLLLPQSRYRCGTCAGRGLVNQVCSECFGALYDFRISSLAIGGRDVAEILTTPLCAIDDLIWRSAEIEYLVRAFPPEFGGRVALGMPLAQLSFPEQRFLSLWGGLARVRSRAAKQRAKKSSGGLVGELVLIDGLSVMTITQRRVIEKLLIEINEMGATVIYADRPQGLECRLDCVLELQAQVARLEQQASEKYLDTRYARLFSNR